jgi:hypothetical protein
VPKPVNSTIIREFSEYMKANGSSDHHQNNNLKVVIAFGYITFLDTKINAEDNEKKWITTWNDHLNRLKLFFRWLCKE